MHHLARIGPAWLRVPLLCLWFPWSMAEQVVRVGLTQPQRLLDAWFWRLPVLGFQAACDGAFVP